MYRRIELIKTYKDLDTGEIEHYKSGLMGLSPKDVIDAWVYKLRGCEHSLPKNSRFYFTEKGWKEVGRKVVEACMAVEQDYRVIAIKETDAQVVWRDKHTGYEVAVQPKRKRE